MRWREDNSGTLFGRLEPLTVEYEEGIAPHDLAAFPEGDGGLIFTWETNQENETILRFLFAYTYRTMKEFPSKMRNCGISSYFFRVLSDQ